MRRRTFLALSGSSTAALAGLAGCLSGSSGDETTANADETSESATGESATESTSERSGPDRTATDASVSVRTDALQPGLVTMSSPDSIAVSPSDGQYLLLDVTVEGDATLLPDDFAFRFGGAEYSPTPLDYPLQAWRFYGNEEAKYDAASGEGILLFELPESAGSVAESSGESSSAALTWPGGEWRPEESVRRRLASPEPPLSVSVDIPESVAVSESPTVTVSVRNEGDVTGRFIAALNRSGPTVAHTPVQRVSFLVPAGETEIWEYADRSVDADHYDAQKIGDGEPDTTYYFDWGDDAIDRDVRYTQAPDSTTDTAL